jgi:hypothetical protein
MHTSASELGARGADSWTRRRAVDGERINVRPSGRAISAETLPTVVRECLTSIAALSSRTMRVHASGYQ